MDITIASKKGNDGPRVFLSGPDQARKRALAAQLGLPATDPPPGSATDLVLHVAADGLSLCCTGSGAPGPIRVDFAAPDALRRARGKDQPLHRAMGRHCATVLDVTAGLGRDTMSLAAAGCQVTAIERHPVLHAMLVDGLLRASSHPQATRFVSRITLVHGDARSLLKTLAASPATDPGRPDVVYLDPMFDGRDRSAQVKKEMQTLRRLLQTDDPAADLDLAQLALAAARRRVVIKRHHGEPALLADPAFSVRGRSLRFDVYLVPGAG